MKAKVEKDILFNALKNALLFTNKSHKIPSISNVLLIFEDNLKLIGTDLITEGIVEVDDIEIIEKGTILTNTRKLFDIVRLSTTDKIDLESDETKLTIKDNDASYELFLLDYEDFSLFDIKNENFSKIKLKKEKLLKSINETLFAINPINYRIYLTGLYIKTLNENSIQFIGSDNYRISFSTLTKEENEIFNQIDLIIPKKTVQHIKKFLSSSALDYVDLYFSEKYLYVKIDNVSVISKLIDEKFPDTTPILTLEYPYKISVEKEKFISALKRASIFHSETESYTILNIKDNEILIYSQDSQYGKSIHKVPIESTPKNFKIAINPKYLLDLDPILIGEKIDLNLIDNEEKILITDDKNPDFKYYVVPYQTEEIEEE